MQRVEVKYIDAQIYIIRNRNKIIEITPVTFINGHDMRKQKD